MLTEGTMGGEAVNGLERNCSKYIASVELELLFIGRQLYVPSAAHVAPLAIAQINKNDRPDRTESMKKVSANIITPPLLLYIYTHTAMLKPLTATLFSQ
jgi:hypothetical protein